MAKAAVAMMLVAVALVAAAIGASADDCKPEQLSPCMPAIVGGSAPTGECCTSLRAQQGCYCQYAKDPNYSKYVRSSNARQTLTACGIAIPDC